MADDEPRSIINHLLRTESVVSVEKFSVRYRQNELFVKNLATESPLKLIDDQWIVDLDSVKRLSDVVLRAFEKYHEANPTGNGLTIDMLKELDP